MSEAQLHHNGLPVDYLIYDDPHARHTTVLADRAQRIVDDERHLHGFSSDYELVRDSLLNLSVFSDDLLNSQLYPDVVEHYDPEAQKIVHKRTGILGSTLTRTGEWATTDKGPLARYTYTFYNRSAHGDSKFIWDDNPGEYRLETSFANDVHGVQRLQDLIEINFYDGGKIERPQSWYERALGWVMLHTGKRRKAIDQ